MKYRVHRMQSKTDNLQMKLEQYLNNLEGEVISVIPHVNPYFLAYGAKIDFILIVEKHPENSH